MTLAASRGTLALFTAFVLALLFAPFSPLPAPPGPPAPAFDQPADNNVRTILVTTVHDGDTVTADICFGTLGRTEFWARGVRLRLKDVRCFELDSKDPQERQVAELERAALDRAILDAAGHLTARLHRQTYDRYEAEIFSPTGNLNQLMLAYPQGGR